VHDSTKPVQWLPVISLLLAASLWGLFWYPLRLFAEHGLSGLWSSLFIYLGTLPALIYILHGRLHELSRAPAMLLLIGLSNGWCNTAFILAMLEGNVVRVLLLFYLSPIWTLILAYLFLGERPHRLGIVTIIIAMLGAVIMLWDQHMGLPLPQSASDWLALSSGMAFSVTNVAVRHTQSVSVRVKTVMAWVGAVLIAGFLLLVGGHSLVVTNNSVILLALLMGLSFMVIMTLSVQYGVTHMPAHRSAVILLFEIVIGAISAYLLTAERMTSQEWLGGAMVMVAAWLSARLPDEPAGKIS